MLISSNLQVAHFLFECIHFHEHVVLYSAGDFLSSKGEKNMFKRNEGILDRLARITLGLVIIPIGLFVLGGLQGRAVGLVFVVVGTVTLVTGLIGICLLYIPFGISTLNMENQLVARCRTMASGCSTNANFAAGPLCWPGSSTGEKTNPPEQPSTSN
jgi:hypothetical protein